MAKTTFSTKRILIDQANAKVVIMTSLAAFVFIFCAVATKTLAGQASYQNKVISARKLALQQVKSDIAAASTIRASYFAFNATSQNVLGGNPSGTGQQDGINSKLILDALPSSYDFPALATSLEKLLSLQNVQIKSISGTDDEIVQGANMASSTPVAVPIPFSISVTGDYTNIQNVVGTFEKSTRPIQLQTMSIAGGQSDLALNITAQTYYQPAKSLNIKTKVVK